MHNAALLVFWSAAAIVAYAYLGFPILIAARAWLCRRRRQPIGDWQLPSVTIVIAAYNEVRSIGKKLDNVLKLNYPRERLEVIVASDGSHDGTNDVVAAYCQLGITLLELPRNGKASALEAAVAIARGDVLVFSDANSMLSRDALQRLVAPLADPWVGGVAGDQRYTNETINAAASGTQCGERGYWHFDRVLKRLESAAGNVVSATGALYAIRRSLFQGVAHGVTDDFYISTGVIEQGCRLVFAEDAVAWEPAAAQSSIEFGRKVRVMTRGLRGVWLRRRLLNPLRYGFYSWQLFSHKALRRLAAIPLIALAASAAFLWDSSFAPAQIIAAGAVFVLVCGTMGAFPKKWPGRSKPAAIAWYFLLVNAASLVALFNVVRRHRVILWEPQRAPLDVLPGIGEITTIANTKA